MVTSLVLFVWKVGQVEVVSLAMENKLFSLLKIPMIALVIRGQELEINTCGPTIDNLELEVVLKKEDSPFTSNQIYTEEQVILTIVTKMKHFPKILISNVDISKFGLLTTELSLLQYILPDLFRKNFFN
jgi:hypothetical protein